jgi:hypothetical protein
MMSREEEQSARQTLECAYAQWVKALQEEGLPVTPEKLAELVSIQFQMYDTRFTLGPVKAWLAKQDWYTSPE